MIKYEWSPSETDLGLYLMGRAVWDVLLRAKVWTLPEGERAHTALHDDGRVECHVPQGHTLSLLHEVGHALHGLRHPESEYWPTEKCEAYAMLSLIRAMKHKAGLTPVARKLVSDYVRGTRREGYPAHRAGLKLAWKAVWAHSRYDEQRDAIANA